MRSLVVFVVIAAAIILLLAPSERPETTVVEKPQHIVLRWKGEIGEDTVSTFREALAPYASDKRKLLISLNSGGGMVKAGAELIGFIRDLQRVREVDTVVENGSMCASMCVPVFLTGEERFAEPKARFMFHEVSFKVTPEMTRLLRDIERKMPNRLRGNVRSMLVTHVTDDFFATFLEPRGVDGKWIANIRNRIRGGRDVWLTAAQLKEQNTGVVDAVRVLR